jgi:hypothetical protein
MNYYFLCASLPELAPTVQPDWTEEAFLEACTLHLSPAHAHAIRTFADGGQVRGSFPEQWLNAETQLRNAIARERGKRRQRDVSALIRTHEAYDTAIEIAVAEAFAARTPQERERLLDHTRWQKADELEEGDLFGLPHLFAYLIKLRIATRWGAHDQDAGVKRIESLLNTDTEKPQEGLTS